MGDKGTMGDKRCLPLILRILRNIEDGMLVAALSVMILLSFGQIVLRNFAHTGVVWGDALLRYLVLWLGLLGAMVATREDNHITIDLIPYFLSGRAKAIVRVFADAFTAAVCVLLTHASITFVRSEMEMGTTAFAKVPTWIAEAILPIALLVITLHYLVFLAIHVLDVLKGTAVEQARHGGEG